MYIAIKNRVSIEITLSGLSQTKMRKYTNQEDIMEEFIRLSRSSTSVNDGRRSGSACQA